MLETWMAIPFWTIASFMGAAVILYLRSGGWDQRWGFGTCGVGRGWIGGAFGRLSGRIPRNPLYRRRLFAVAGRRQLARRS